MLFCKRQFQYVCKCYNPSIISSLSRGSVSYFDICTLPFFRGNCYSCFIRSIRKQMLRTVNIGLVRCRYISSAPMVIYIYRWINIYRICNPLPSPPQRIHCSRPLSSFHTLHGTSKHKQWSRCTHKPVLNYVLVISLDFIRKVLLIFPGSSRTVYCSLRFTCLLVALTTRLSSFTGFRFCVD